ncbi:MAG TPA: NADH-quinone oxidoreductase subunit C [Chloroflexota bacterium]|nr:NADH-quinone oxidoreductase subunit C [Chloroflexota bacterium]
MEEQASASAPTPVEVATSRLNALLASLSIETSIEPVHGYLECTVPADRLEDVALRLRDDLGYAYLSMVTAVDYPDQLVVIYLAFSLEHPNGVMLKASLPREGIPDCPSLTKVWPGAEFQEREVYDLMGINFVGHPDLRRILTDDDFPGHPLRKDFSIEPDYVLMRHLRFGAEGQLAPNDATRGRGE